MNKKIIGLGLTAGLIFSSVLPAQAETLYGASDWNVTFTSGSSLESNFKTANMNDVVSGMQPGDEVILTMRLYNQNSNTTDWYMTNKIMNSLEDNSVANGGAYTYQLTYESSAGTYTSLYDSEKVGGEKESPVEDETENEDEPGQGEGTGENTGDENLIPTNSKAKVSGDIETDGDKQKNEGTDVSANDVSSGNPAGLGLHEATNSLEEYFRLDTLESGQSGKITLKIALDGETQGNDYQNTLADLTMNFAVERRPSPHNRHRSPKEVIKIIGNYLEDEEVPLAMRSSTVRTSDDSRLILFAALAFTSGLALFLLSVYCRKAGRKEEE